MPSNCQAGGVGQDDGGTAILAPGEAGAKRCKGAKVQIGAELLWKGEREQGSRGDWLARVWSIGEAELKGRRETG